MWHPENCSFVHSRVIVDRTLNFGAVNIFAGTDDHVFDTVFDVNKTIGVETTNVT